MDGHVLELTKITSSDEIILEGIVRGSGKHIYEASIAWNIDEGASSLVAECTCPIAFDCKHAAALFISYFNDDFDQQKNVTALPEISQINARKQPLNPQMSGWLDDISNLTLPETTNNSTKNAKKLLYVIEPSIKKYSYKLNFHSAAILKSGNFGVIKPVGRSSLESSAKYISEQDRDILDLFKLSSLHQNNYYSSDFTLSGKYWV